MTEIPVKLCLSQPERTMSVQRNCLNDGIILMKAARKELEKGKNELFKVVVAEICRGRTSDIVPSYKEDARIRAGEKQHSRPESETIINVDEGKYSFQKGERKLFTFERF